MSFKSSYPPYDPTDKSGFSYETVLKRWPVIITGVIDQLYQECHALSLASQNPGAKKQEYEAKIVEGRGIIERISKLKYGMARDHPLEPIAEDGERHVDTYNKELARLAENSKNTWYTAPWLYAECYLYRFLRSLFVQTDNWNDYDPFLAQKIKTFKQSGSSIFQIATTMYELENEKSVFTTTEIAVLFKEMIQMCLWGNATDLSLLTHLSQADMEHLQSVGKDAQQARQQYILRDDQDKAWEHVKTLKGGRIDFVLDNSGFELFTDLVFADFLVTFTPYASTVYFHPKDIPWFVSDVTPSDFKDTFEFLLDPSFFDTSADAAHTPNFDHLKHMVSRWRKYVDQGIFKLSVPTETPLGGGGTEGASFWSTPWPYWNMESLAPEIFQTLKLSDLVIFKGDLNYRKLTGDVRWPAWTPFAEAIGPLAGSFPLLSLRTNKADVVTGLEREKAEQLDASGEKWRVDGRYALISFLNSEGF